MTAIICSRNVNQSAITEDEPHISPMSKNNKEAKMGGLAHRA